MTSQIIKDRLINKKWAIYVCGIHEIALVLNACADADIQWADGSDVKEWTCDDFEHITFISSSGDGILKGDGWSRSRAEDITEWFFTELAKDNNMQYLTPKNAEQEHLIQILLAKLQGIEVECKHKHECDIWSFSGSSCLSFDVFEYRIKPKHTPLPIPDELWRLIDNKYTCAVLTGKNGEYIGFVENDFLTMHEDDQCWSHRGIVINASGFNINTDGIDWKYSLTERPSLKD